MHKPFILAAILGSLTIHAASAADQKPFSVDDLVRTLVLTSGAELELEVWRSKQTVKLALTPVPQRRQAA